MTKQEAVIKYIEDNYLQFNRLRHDVISDKLQLRMEKPTPDPSLKGGENSAAASVWREMTKHDINSIVCHCAQECDVNITSREVMTALQSDLIPDVHPLREYILSLPPFTPDQPDWIDLVAQKVTVKPSLLSDDRPKGLLDRTSCCETTALRDRTEGTERPMESLSEACERSKADRLWRGCFKKWFVAMVASWMKDEVVNHQVLVLIGKQGIFKTTWLEQDRKSVV